MAVNGTFKSHYTECKLTNARLDSTVEYIKSYISMMSMRDKILESSVPQVHVVDKVGPPTSMYGTWNESSIAISQDRFEEYQSYDSITKQVKVDVISEKLVRIKWNEENDVKAVFPGIEENAPGEMTPMLDVVFAPLQSRKPVMDMIHGAKVEKEMLLMPCPLTKYLGTEFCPEFTAETAFDVSSAAALTTLYRALSSNVPKVSRELLERALDAIPTGPQEAQGAEEVQEAEAGEDDECKTDKADESKETAEEIAVNELCEAVMLEADKTARDTKMRALQAYYDKWVAGIGHKSKDKLLKQIDGLKVWLENDDKKSKPVVHYVTPEEKAAADKEAAKAKIREVNEQMKKMRELQAIWADASATVDEKAAAQKGILDICAKQVEASTLKRDPIEEVLENLWGFFRQEMLSTYKKSGANIEVGWNRQKWMILANWLQVNLLFQD
jgi:hypothetical protein